jgi:signal peptidase I
MKRLSFFLIFLFLLSCRGRYYRIPSACMEETIMAGEQFFVTSADKFERNDIVVFNYFGPDYSSPDEETGTYNLHWEKRIFRLIAYSADSLEIKDGEVFVNSRHIALPPKAKLRYEVVSKVPIEEFDEKYPFAGAVSKSGDTYGYDVDLTVEQAFIYEQRKPAIVSVKRKFPEPVANDTMYARASQNGKWSSAYFGPLRIPSPGETIDVDSVNYKLYHNIPGIKAGKNLLQEKLYFVLGDNRYAAEDSRFIGLISHSKMYGVVK